MGLRLMQSINTLMEKGSEMVLVSFVIELFMLWEMKKTSGHYFFLFHLSVLSLLIAFAEDSLCYRAPEYSLLLMSNKTQKIL